MKKAQISDWWRHVNSFKHYRVKLKSVKFESVPFFENFELTFNSSISFLTGRNGIGKTSFLKLVCEMINNESSSVGYISDEKRKGISVVLNVSGEDRTYNHSTSFDLPINVEYFDASSFSRFVLDSIAFNPDKTWSKESEPRALSDEDIDVIRKVTGKRYDEILIEEALPEERPHVDNKVIPLFTVTLGDVRYTNEGMGTGELKALVLIWKLLTVEENSILFIEEPESFICPNYQKKLVDFLAWYASTKKLNLVISTHSEHILTTQRSPSSFILQKTGLNRFKLVPENSEARYLTALGLTPKVDKILLVEDDFAKLFLKLILESLDTDYSSTASITKLSGESDLTAVLGHLQDNDDIKIICVFDADQIGKKLNVKPKLKFLFLPSISKNAPEEEIINYLESNTAMLADTLNMDEAVLEAILDDHIEDHHDWFIELEKKIPSVTLSDLKYKCIKLWIDAHKELCEQFVFELRNLGFPFDAKLVKDKSKFIASTSCGNSFEISNPLAVMPKDGEQIKVKLVYSSNSERVLRLLN